MKKNYTRPALELIKIKSNESVTNQLSSGTIQTNLKSISLTDLQSGSKNSLSY